MERLVDNMGYMKLECFGYLLKAPVRIINRIQKRMEDTNYFIDWEKFQCGDKMYDHEAEEFYMVTISHTDKVVMLDE